MWRAAPLLGLVAAACASGGAPAPISYGQERTPEASSRPVADAPSQETDEVAAPVDRTQSDWADGEGTPLSAYALQPSSIDPRQTPRTHTVAANESLYDIATRYQIPLRALIDQNSLAPPFALAPGRVLQLPPPRFHMVERNETLEDTASHYSVDLRSLALLNRMQAPYRVSRGDRILVPALARQSTPAPQPEPLTATTAPSSQDRGQFAWPLRGEIVSRFGPQAGGTRLDGVEIAGREGAAVAAAADGNVVYSGADIEGLGTLILIRHAENFVTAYGYNRRSLVREGQSVRRGEQIAELGTRPGGGARLLFQVRRGNEALDPAPLLAPAR